MTSYVLIRVIGVYLRLICFAVFDVPYYRTSWAA